MILADLEQVRRRRSTFVKFGIRSGHRLFILDAQHRNQALQELWDETIEAVAQGLISTPRRCTRSLRKSSVPMLIVLEGDRDEISPHVRDARLDEADLAQPDRRDGPREPGQPLRPRGGEASVLLGQGDRLAFQTSTATGETLYAAARCAGRGVGVHRLPRPEPDMREEALARIVAESHHPEEQALNELVAEAVELLDYT